MGVRQRLPHPDTWEVVCDACGAESSDASVQTVYEVAAQEDFSLGPDGLWRCVDCANACPRCRKPYVRKGAFLRCPDDNCQPPEVA